MTETQIETQHLLDLSRYEWKRTQGDVTLYGTWSLHNGRPVMVLVPTQRQHTFEQVTPCLVPLDLAFLWDEHTGDPAHCAHASFAFANALGIDAYNPRSIIRLTSIIRDHLGDLLAMPPMPSTEREVVADTLMTDPNTGRSVEAEITDYV